MADIKKPNRQRVIFKSDPYNYRRDLPHIQAPGRLFFITFGTANRWVLPETARDIILQTCLREHGTRIYLHARVVMPEHIHMLLSVLPEASAPEQPLFKILGDIKSISAHRVNKVLERTGRVWQEESFDHIVRHVEGFEHYVNYIRENPVRRALTKTPEEYKWLWCAPRA